MDNQLKNAIAQKAAALGFDAVGFTTPQLPADAAGNLQVFLAQGNHGDMGWLAERVHWRGSPNTLWPEARSVIVLGHNYGPNENPMKKLGNKTAGNISCYALNEDYHEVIKKKLKELARWLAQAQGCEVKVFVDTAPVMEKPLAQMAGVGWQGKHTCVVSREFGSWLFIGSVFTTLHIPAEGRGPVDSVDQTPQHVRGSCGSCTACINICPTQAITAPYQLDARKCISYLTIEHKGQIPLEYRKAIGNRIYGCDDCLAVCPWNKFAQTAKEQSYHAREDLQAPLLSELVALNNEDFRSLFRKSPVKRIGRERFIRNVLVAIGNSEDKALLPTLTPLLQDPSPLISDMAGWAIEELGKCDKF